MLAESLRYIDKRGRESKPTLHGKQAFEAMGVLGGGCYNLVSTAAQELSTVKESLVNENSNVMEMVSKSPIKDTSNPPTISASGSVAEELSEFQNALHVFEGNQEELERLLENDVTTIISEQCAIETPWIFNPALLVSEALQKYFPDCTVSTLSYKDLESYKFRIDIPDKGLFMVTRMGEIVHMEFYYVKGTNAESTFDVRMKVLKVITDDDMIAERKLQLLTKAKYSEVTQQKLEFAELVDAGFVLEDFAYELYGDNYEIKTLFFKDSRNWQFMITVNKDVYIISCFGCRGDVFGFDNGPGLQTFLDSFQAYIKSGKINQSLKSDAGGTLITFLTHADVQEKIKAISLCAGNVRKLHKIQEFSGKLTLTSTVDDVKWRVGGGGCFPFRVADILCGSKYSSLHLLGK